MDSRCLFQGERRDVLALIATVEASRPQTKDPPTDPADNWDSLAADLAASYFTGNVLRWYEGLGTAEQESWVSLRTSLLAKFVTDDESDQSRYTQEPHTKELTEANSLL